MPNNLATWQSLPRFGEAIDNPPSGEVVTESNIDWIGYRGPAGLTVAKIGLKATRLGIKIILPQAQTPYRFSGRRPGENVYAASHTSHLSKFMAQYPNLEWGHSSLDTEYEAYKSGWRGASPVVELVSLYDPDAWLIPLPAPVARPPTPRASCRLALTG
ncbi:MAG: hypothetical protein L0332_29670 [Chloroflexi bacterium]|nr:hypothetical protein [Chloroflexota bacterium]MCI0730869.1 hypothetical protein [Chloroflexota bacterium]